MRPEKEIVFSTCVDMGQLISWLAVSVELCHSLSLSRSTQRRSNFTFRCQSFESYLEPQSPAKIVGTLPPNAVFQLLAHLLVLPILFITVNSPNLVYQHWEGKKTAMADLDLQIRWGAGRGGAVIQTLR